MDISYPTHNPPGTVRTLWESYKAEDITNILFIADHKLYALISYKMVDRDGLLEVFDLEEQSVVNICADTPAQPVTAHVSVSYINND